MLIQHAPLMWAASPGARAVPELRSAQAWLPACTREPTTAEPRRRWASFAAAIAAMSIRGAKITTLLWAMPRSALRQIGGAQQLRAPGFGNVPGASERHRGAVEIDHHAVVGEARPRR